MDVDKLIDMTLCGRNPATVLEDVVSGSTALLSPATASIHRPGGSVTSVKVVRSYFDSYGRLKFCTLEDVQVTPDSDPRLQELVQYAELAPADHVILDWLDGYEGPLDEIYRRVTSSFCLAL